MSAARILACLMRAIASDATAIVVVLALAFGAVLVMVSP